MSLLLNNLSKLNSIGSAALYIAVSTSLNSSLKKR
jgi:hypothetical protein